MDKTTRFLFFPAWGRLESVEEEGEEEDDLIGSGSDKIEILLPPS